MTAYCTAQSSCIYETIETRLLHIGRFRNAGPWSGKMERMFSLKYPIQGACYLKSLCINKNMSNCFVSEIQMERIFV